MRVAKQVVAAIDVEGAAHRHRLELHQRQLLSPLPMLILADVGNVAGPAREKLAQWIEAIAGHDERALAALYDATFARVFGLVRRIVRISQRNRITSIADLIGSRPDQLVPAHQPPGTGKAAGTRRPVRSGGKMQRFTTKGVPFRK